MSGFDKIFNSFQILGDLLFAEPYGNGHINDTYRVNVSQGGAVISYLFQRINNRVFSNPVDLMENIERICSHLEKGASSRNVLTLIKSKDGRPYVVDDEDNYWRAYIFIERALGYDIVETEKQAFEAAAAFGRFQALLSDIPGKRLKETIENFHNTPVRLEKFKKALRADSCSRAETVRREIDFYLSFENHVSELIDRITSGELPERVTHNDTKLNNVLLDIKTGEAVCVIDLDTSMPGLAAYDFGDLVRTSTCLAAEDEKDLSKVVVQRNLYEALIRGYLSTGSSFLTEEEVKSLVFGGILITYEVGLRFLTDYLEGDIYFKARYGDHNLVRSRMQMALVEALIDIRDDMEALALSVYMEMSCEGAEAKA